MQMVAVPEEAQSEPKREHRKDRTKSQEVLAFPVLQQSGEAAVRPDMQVFATLPVCKAGLRFMVQVRARRLFMNVPVYCSV
jgi:hypothetical protein